MLFSTVQIPIPGTSSAAADPTPSPQQAASNTVASLSRMFIVFTPLVHENAAKQGFQHSVNCGSPGFGDILQPYSASNLRPKERGLMRTGSRREKLTMATRERRLAEFDGTGEPPAD